MDWRGGEYSARLAQVLAEGLTHGAEHLKAQSVPRTPLRDGPLRASAQVHPATPGDLESAVSFDTPYAVRQHEELDWFHPLDGEAKYLERPLVEDSDTILRIIGRGVGGIQ